MKIDLRLIIFTALCFILLICMLFNNGCTNISLGDASYQTFLQKKNYDNVKITLEADDTATFEFEKSESETSEVVNTILNRILPLIPVTK